MTTPIHILSGSSLVNLSELEGLGVNLRAAYRNPVDFKRLHLDLNVAYDASRGQFNSTVLLSQLLTRTGDDRHKTIILVDVDLFIPVLTFVFGEAQFDGTAAVVSTHRLANQYYGLPQNHGRLIARIEKEIIHELGHTFGLYHCRQYECVMRSSTYVEEIDMKKWAFCEDCRSVIESRTGPQADTGNPA